jgi:hypothetical protein
MRAVLVLVFFAPLAARAQNQAASPYDATVYREGPGFRLGEAPLVIHPGLAVEAGYDSNVFYLPSREVGSALLRLRLHLDMATLPPQLVNAQPSSSDPKIDFRLTTQVEYREYLTDNSKVQDQRSVNVLASADLGILPYGPFTLRLNDTFLRSVDPRNAESSRQFSRDTNRVGVLATYRPFASGNLEFGLGDYFQFNLYEDKDVSFGNYLSDEAQAFGRLRVLPRTVLQLLVRAGYIEYSHDAELESVPFRVLFGASTMFTTWLGASANLGYGNSFSSKGASYNNVIANAELRFLLPYAAKVTLSYDRDFYDSMFARFYVDDHIFVTFDQPLIKHISAHVDGGVRFRHYGTLVTPTIIGAATYNLTARNDRVYDAHVEFIYRPLAWFEAAVSYNLIADDTKFAFVNGTTTTPVNYIKHSAFFRADFSY